MKTENSSSQQESIAMIEAREASSFRLSQDVFPEEVLAVGGGINLVTMTVLFTDLRESTRLYEEVGDGPAFHLVMDHFSLLKVEIGREKGVIVKTIGDAVMAVFQQPISAVRAVLAAQQKLADPPEGAQPLVLKAGIHVGPCIRVNLDNHLDYFGSAVNLAARLEKLSTGRDVVISSAVFKTREISELLCQSRDNKDKIRADPVTVVLKGFNQVEFTVWRIWRQCHRADS